MPTIQEIAVRNANPARARGVSVYSPQQQHPCAGGQSQPRHGAARPAGRVAEGSPVRSGTDMSAGSQMQLPGYRPPDQAGRGRTGRTPLDDILDSMSANDPQPQEEEGGWKGALGTVVNSMPFKAVMAPLNILDIPRRAVVSTVNEVADVFNGGDASWDDWFDQVKDPNFGFGSVVGSTGNIWADRFIGFAGDVLLDPLTYVAGAGVFSGTGRADPHAACFAGSVGGIGRGCHPLDRSLRIVGGRQRHAGPPAPGCRPRWQADRRADPRPRLLLEGPVPRHVPADPRHRCPRQHDLASVRSRAGAPCRGQDSAPGCATGCGPPR